MVSGPSGAILSTVSTLSRVVGVIVIGAGLGACAVGSMGAMMGGGANGVASVSADNAQPVEIGIQSRPRRIYGHGRSD